MNAPQQIDRTEDVRDFLDRILKERDIKYQDVSRMLGHADSYIQQYIRRGVPRELRERDRRAIATFLNIPETMLGAPPAPDLPVTPLTGEAFGQNDIPVYAAAQGGDGEMLISYDAIELRPRPSNLANVPDAYAMYVVNDSMEPRYAQGELLLIHPHKPARSGADVLVVLSDDGHEYHAMIKRLVRRNDKELVLLQYNPRKEIIIPTREVKTLHLVMGGYWQE